MTGALAALALVMIAWASFAAVTSLVVSATWRSIEGRLEAAPPAWRSRAAVAAAVSPGVVPTLLVLTCLAPGLLGLLGPGDHCIQHADHPHLCVVHLGAAIGAPLALVPLVGGIALLAALLRWSTAAFRSRRWLLALGTVARRTSLPGVNVVASGRPFCFATGMGRGEIWIASSLLEKLSEDELAVVLAHERAHLARRDPLRAATAAALSWPLWPPVRRRVLAALELASEQACDEAAGLHVGDRLRVAETILAVERILGRATPAGPSAVPAFGGSNVAARVDGLLESPCSATLPATAGWAGFALLASASALGADALHHATEHWIRLLLGGG